jgi:hypothetical protein
MPTRWRTPISSRPRKFGVPPPQCIAWIARELPSSGASSASSFSKYLIYLDDLPWSRVTTLLQAQ